MNMGDMVKFQGHSDDVLCYEHIKFQGDAKTEHDEFGADEGCAVLLVEDQDGNSCQVMASYIGGCWHLALGQTAEDRFIPSYWRISITQADDCAYSVCLTIDGRVSDRIFTVKQIKDED